MGHLRNAIEKIKKRKMESNNNNNAAVAGYNASINPNREMLFASSITFYQNANEIYVGKNRMGPKNGFMELSEVIDVIIKEYFRGDLTDELTPSACWNVPIKEDLDVAIREVLSRYNIS